MNLKEKEYFVEELSVKRTKKHTIKANMVCDVDLAVAELKKEIEIEETDCDCEKSYRIDTIRLYEIINEIFGDVEE